MSDKYILDKDGNPQLETNLMKWAAWYEKPENRLVKSTVIENCCVISTIFLGLDFFNITGKNPQLFQTKIFVDYPLSNVESLGLYSKFEERYATRDEALVRHEEIVETLREILPKDRKLKY